MLAGVDAELVAMHLRTAKIVLISQQMLQPSLITRCPPPADEQTDQLVYFCTIRLHQALSEDLEQRRLLQHAERGLSTKRRSSASGLERVGFE